MTKRLTEELRFFKNKEFNETLISGLFRGQRKNLKGATK